MPSAQRKSKGRGLAGEDVEENMITENVSRDIGEAEESHTKSHTRSVFSSDASLRKVASWGAVIGAIGLGSFLALFLAIQAFHPTDPNTNWMIAQFKQHFAATIGIPLSALSAFCIVTLLRATTGPIEIESRFINFRGASGPIIFWILCFIVTFIGVKDLWGLSQCP
jgi:hypothetical protein